MPTIYTPPRRPGIRYEPAPAPEDFFITDSYGYTHRATSYEYNVAIALWKYGITFRFQFPLAGGRSRSGGLVIDFVIDVVPLPQPVLVNGDYWHRNKAREFYYSALVDQYLRGTMQPVITWWGSDTSTPEAADRSVRKIL